MAELPPADAPPADPAVEPSAGPSIDETVNHARVRTPVWLDNVAAIGWRLIVTLAFIVVVIVAIARLWVPVSVVLVAICVVAAVRPFAIGLRQRGWSRRAASVSAGALAIGVTVAVVIIGVLAIVPVVPQILTAVAEGAADLRAAFAAIGLPPEFTALIDAMLDQPQGLDHHQRDATWPVMWRRP